MKHSLLLVALSIAALASCKKSDSNSTTPTPSISWRINDTTYTSDYTLRYSNVTDYKVLSTSDTTEGARNAVHLLFKSFPTAINSTVRIGSALIVSVQLKDDNYSSLDATGTDASITVNDKGKIKVTIPEMRLYMSHKQIFTDSLILDDSVRFSCNIQEE